MHFVNYHLFCWIKLVVYEMICLSLNKSFEVKIPVISYQWKATTVTSMKWTMSPKIRMKQKIVFIKLSKRPFLEYRETVIFRYFTKIEHFQTSSQKWPFYNKNYPNPSRTVVSLISASFAVENDFRNRSDAFLLNFYIFFFIYRPNWPIFGFGHFEIDRRIFSRKRL